MFVRTGSLVQFLQMAEAVAVDKEQQTQSPIVGHVEEQATGDRFGQRPRDRQYQADSKDHEYGRPSLGQLWSVDEAEAQRRNNNRGGNCQSFRKT